MWRRVGRTLVVLQTLLLLGVCLAGAASAHKRCGSFLISNGDFRITVFKSEPTTCRGATRVLKEFKKYQRVVGYDEPYGLKRYPGWRCYEGAGGGNCYKGRRTASYAVRVSSAPPVASVDRVG